MSWLLGEEVNLNAAGEAKFRNLLETFFFPYGKA